MIVWGVHTSNNADGKPFSFMNFSTKEMMRVIPKAMQCYGKILPLMEDGVHKLVVHDQWLLVFWGFPSRRFDVDSRKNRCAISCIYSLHSPAMLLCLCVCRQRFNPFLKYHTVHPHTTDTITNTTIHTIHTHWMDTHTHWMDTHIKSYTYKPIYISILNDTYLIIHTHNNWMIHT